MDDFKIIIYILLGVAYLIFNNWRKAFKDPNETNLPDDARYPEEPKRSSRPQNPPTSLEEMLRQLQPKAEKVKTKGEELVAQAKDKAKEVLAPVPQVKVVDYEAMPPQRALSWEKRAEAIEAAKHSKLRRQKEFSAYDQPKAKAQRYRDMLQNLSSVRDAFVLSEIFKRKYE